MYIKTVANNRFELLYSNDFIIGSLCYKTPNYRSGFIVTESETLSIAYTHPGQWYSFRKIPKSVQRLTLMKVGLGGIMKLCLLNKKKKYQLKKTNGWKLRLMLINKEGEEVLALIPFINWEKKTHDYTIQVNDEYLTECDPFLILHTVHCANCCLSMMNGGIVPPLINI